jgi:signal transduction histidine kinase
MRELNGDGVTDEEKTREQLVEELRELRSRMNRTLDESGKPKPAGRGPTLSETFEFSDLEWDVQDISMPALDQSLEGEDVPRFLAGPYGKTTIEDAQGWNITETGSYDMRWISFASFGRLLHAIPIPVLLIDPSGSIQFANNAFLKLPKGDSIATDSFYAMFPESDVEGVRLLVENALTKRSLQSRKGTLILKDNEIWSRMNLRSIRFGLERSILALIEDLTAEKRELTLNAKYKGLVDIFPIGIAEFKFRHRVCPDSCVDESLSDLMDARLIDGNIQFARLNGRESLDELKEIPFGDILSRQQNEMSFRRWIATGFSMISFEAREIAADGQFRYFENILVGNVQEGSVVQFWVMKQDITEGKRVQEELAEKLRTIDELYEHIVQSGKAKAIAEHTAKVAHELRQPLAIIGGFTRRMARESSAGAKPAHDSKNESFDIIIKEVQRLEKILDGLIDFSRHETMTLTPVNPHELIDYVLRINRGRLKEKNLRVDLDLDRGVTEIPVDAERFQQVIRNLVANAIEASPPYSSIRIETGVSTPGEKAHKTGELRADRYFQMKVQNHGKMIPPEDLERIFDPFFTTKNYGTGLGLTLSKRIVEDHSGSISVKSDKQATSFTVWLPLITPGDGVTCMIDGRA